MTSLHKKTYGNWAGNTRGQPADLNRCCEEVTFYIGSWPHNKQCSRKRGHGPEGAYCKQHNPETQKIRRDASYAKWLEGHKREMVKMYGPTFLKALELIAEGHNDPRTLARDTIASLQASLEKYK